MKKTKILVAVSIDVEEEGLFTGRYACKNLSLRNIAFLHRLGSLCEIGIRPTLFCAWPVFNNPGNCAVLNSLRHEYRLETGCHLHHWNTPPFENDHCDFLTDVASGDVKIELFEKKLVTLLQAAENCLGEHPVSFRMGRWDLYSRHFAILSRHGIKCDASLRPLHAPAENGKAPDHFNAPDDPFWLEGDFGKIFEVPLTVTPIFRKLPAICDRLGFSARASLKNWGALALLPVYHPLWLMKLASKLHINSGGRVLSLTWHSSEMMPGGAPHVPDEKKAAALLSKIAAWFEWLRGNYNVESLTMRELMDRQGKSSPVVQMEYCMNLPRFSKTVNA